MFIVMMIGVFSQNFSKLFSELKLVTDNLLFIYAEAKWEKLLLWAGIWIVPGNIPLICSAGQLANLLNEWPDHL